MAKRTSSDPLAPLEAITNLFATLTIAAVVVLLISVATGSNGSVLGFGGDDVCVSTTNYAYGDAEIDELDRRDLGIRKNVRIGSTDTLVCDEKPGNGAQILSGLTQAPTFVVFLGFVLLTLHTIRYARTHGLFSHELARRIERLGWLVLLGMIVAAVIEWLAEGQLLSAMLDDADWGSGSFGMSVPGIIGAYGLVSIGRIMQRAANLQDDTDATI